MSAFYRLVMDYIYEKRLELFQATFYSLYNQYGVHNRTEDFMRSWFEGYTFRKLIKYFPIEDVLRYYPDYVRRKRRVIRSYVWAYWAFCKNPQRRPHKFRESLEFFGLDRLDPQSLKSRYRQLVKQYHPDTYPDRKEAHKKMLLINYHYQVLMSYLK